MSDHDGSVDLNGPSVRSLQGFLDVLAKVRMPHTDGFYTFRGSENCEWGLEAGIMRPGREKLLAAEKDAVRELIAVQPQQFLSDICMFDKLVRMQHFGMPTRLLDVTANPLVALYFACIAGGNSASDGAVSCIFVPYSRRKFFDSDTVSCIANLANLSAAEKAELASNIHQSAIKSFNGLGSTQRLLQFIRGEKPYFLDQIVGSQLNKLWYVLPKLSNARIIAQQGAFLISGLQPSQEPCAESVDAIVVKNIEVDYRCKMKIRESLTLLGINEAELFPEIDKAAKYIADSYCA